MPTPELPPMSLLVPEKTCNSVTNRKETPVKYNNASGRYALSGRAAGWI